MQHDKHEAIAYLCWAMILIILLGVLGLLGQGGTAKAAPPVEPGPCSQVANFARAIAILRASGIPEAQLEDYISTTKVQSFPITLIRHRVYAEALTPDRAHDMFNNICLAGGYSNIVQFMTNEDERIKEQEQNVQLRIQVERQHQYINQLQAKLGQQPTCPTEHKVIAYGTPIESN